MLTRIDMKIIKLFMFLVAVTIPLKIYAETSCSVPSVKFEAKETKAHKIEKIADALQNYKKHLPSFLSAKSGQYEICFDMSDVLDVSKSDIVIDKIFDGAFKFTIDAGDTRDVTISGLKLKRNENTVLYLENDSAKQLMVRDSEISCAQANSNNVTIDKTVRMGCERDKKQDNDINSVNFFEPNPNV